jgi:hypothetical protein
MTANPNSFEGSLEIELLLVMASVLSNYDLRLVDEFEGLREGERDKLPQCSGDLHMLSLEVIDNKQHVESHLRIVSQVDSKNIMKPNPIAATWACADVVSAPWRKWNGFATFPARPRSHLLHKCPSN